MNPAKEILENEKTIGLRRYQVLKTYDFDKMGVDEILQFKKERKMSVAQAEKEIAKYESKHKLSDYQIEAKKKYVEKILNPIEFKPKKLTAEVLYKYFILRYSFIYRVDYDISKGSDYLENLKTLLFYFTKDERFFKQKNVIESIGFGSKTKISKPSFDKGLILIGGFGTGKTSSMNTFQVVFKELLAKGFDAPIFRTFTTQFLAESFENCKNAPDKKNFWDSIKKGRIFFDDLKAESKASNFGVKDVMQETLQKREYMIDYVSINFDDDYPNDISKALLEIGKKYGSRVFDRIFSKWNIIEFKGKSFRGLK